MPNFIKGTFEKLKTMADADLQDDFNLVKEKIAQEWKNENLK